MRPLLTFLNPTYPRHLGSQRLRANLVQRKMMPGDCPEEEQQESGEAPRKSKAPRKSSRRKEEAEDVPEEESGQGQAVVEETPPAAEQLVPEVPKKTSRLMIKQIVLHNFKSYGGRKVIGPFHKSFSSIVGPNGSGKSNTIDALLFVFGKRAKKIRLNKISELIHCSKGHEKL